jgi:hypothetical protein
VSFISKILISITVISLPILAMEPPKSSDWWGLKIQGSPTIKAQADNNIISIKISDITGLCGEVRAHTVNIQCSPEQEKNIAYGKYLKVLAKIFIVNNRSYPSSPNPLSPSSSFLFSFNDFSESDIISIENSQPNLFYLPLEYINTKQSYITIDTISRLIECIKEQFRKGMDPIHVETEGSMYLGWKFSVPLILKDEADKHHIYGFKLLTGPNPKPTTIEELKEKFQSFIQSFNKFKNCEDEEYKYSIQRWSRSNPPYYNVRGGVIHPIDSKTVLGMTLYIQPTIADDDF